MHERDEGRSLDGLSITANSVFLTEVMYQVCEMES
jgi:hypothetical protein